MPYTVHKNVSTLSCTVIIISKDGINFNSMTLQITSEFKTDYICSKQMKSTVQTVQFYSSARDFPNSIHRDTD